MKTVLSFVSVSFLLLLATGGHADVSNKFNLATEGRAVAKATNPNVSRLVKPRWYCASYCAGETELELLFKNDSNGSRLFVRQGLSPEKVFGELQSSCAAFEGASLVQGTFIAGLGSHGEVLRAAINHSHILNSCIRLR